MTRVAIVGCGGVGRKRAAALGDARLVACVDVVLEHARELADAGRSRRVRLARRR